MSDTILTPTEAGKILKVSPKTVVALCARGDIPGARKVGRRWRIADAADAADGRDLILRAAVDVAMDAYRAEGRA